ncbi:glycosyltransferase [Gloeocapsa sp. PCC 73106]|nr:glycosyltransferase [Gloeocapsa sp. PCC 73106]
MLSLREGLASRGHDVRLFSSDVISVVGEPLLADYTCFGTNSRLQAVSQTFNISAYRKLRQIMQEFRPDVVHVRMFMWQMSPLILPLLKKVPCLYQTAVYKAICPLGTKTLPDGSPCQQKMGTACLKQGCLTPQSWITYMTQAKLWQQWRQAFDLVVALSYRMKAKLEAEGIKPVKVVYNGVPERPSRPDLSDPPTVAYAGRLVKEKGIDVLLKAFAQIQNTIPQIRLLIAGQGPEHNNLRSLASKLGIDHNLIWLGHISRSQLEDKFNSAWVQVIPSLWEEPFGNVTTEAMIRGTAVIASAVGAQPEIVEDRKTGFLVPPNDVDALAKALLNLLLNQSLAEEMGQLGRLRAQTYFSEDCRTETFIEIYQNLYSAYHGIENFIS